MMYDQVRKDGCVKRVILSDFFLVRNFIKYKIKQHKSILTFYYPMHNIYCNCSGQWLKS